MNKKELKAKRAVIRNEIKERMQDELDRRKEEIKRRIKDEDISVEEKREKYRLETHQEKLRLMEVAKREFVARKRMLGQADEESYEEIEGDLEEDLVETPVMDPQWGPEGDMLAEEEETPGEPSEGLDPESAFLLEDDDGSEEREVLRELESPIGESDALPPEAEQWVDKTGVAEAVEEEPAETRGLFYFIVGLIVHPIQALDEFDDYIVKPSGLRNVALFYLASLMPVAIFGFMAQTAGAMMPGGMLGSIIQSSMMAHPSIMLHLGKTVLDLLLYSLSIAVVNYFVSDEANVITLTTYFAFVEGVTGVIIYTLVIVFILAAVIAPPLLGLVFLLFLAFIVWRVALNIIVLMSAYGYGFFSAIILAIGAHYARKLIYIFVSGLMGASLEETLYPSPLGGP